MKTREEIRDLYFELNRIDSLKSIQKSLHKLAELDCNYGLTPKQEKREQSLIKKAEVIASEINCNLYYQGDPRGCALWLVCEDDKKSRNYTNGIPL